METNSPNEQKKQNQSPLNGLEESAIDVLLHSGVTFNVPLRKEEIATLTASNSLFNKLFHRKPKTALPPEIKVNRRRMPNPLNPQEEIDYYEAEVNIRPLYYATICAIRKIRLQLEKRDPNFEEKLNANNPQDTRIFDIPDLMQAVAIATLNIDDTKKYASEIKQWVNFYNRHLTGFRYIKLVQVVMAMMDAQSFQNSTRLILGLGTTAPREANRVEKAQS